MTKLSMLGLLAATAIAAPYGGAFGQATAAGAGASAAVPAGLEEIVVTANRRAEKSQDVPIMVTVFNAARLEQQGINKEQDLQATVPSLVVGANGQGSRETQSFTIRGQGATFQASPAVVVYMNEVPLPGSISLSQQGGPGDFLDLDNVQVLSGPQGTLFGRNTTGGAVLLSPKKPTNDFEGSIEGKWGNYNAESYTGIINVPIIADKLIVRVAADYNYRDGYTHDISFNKDRDNVNNYNGRIGIMFRPTDDIESYTMAYDTLSHTNGVGQVATDYNIPLLGAFGLCNAPGVGPCSTYNKVLAAQNARGPRVIADSMDSFQKTRTWGYENTTDFHLDPSLTIRNIVSYQRMTLGYAYDGDGTVLQQYDNSNYAVPAPGAVSIPGQGPVNYLNASTTGKEPRDNFEVVTEELQAQGNWDDGKLTVTSGLFFFDQKPVGTQAVTSTLYCPALFTGFCPASYQQSSVSQESEALYAQGTLDFGLLDDALDRLKLTAGARYSWDHIVGSAFQYSPFGSTSPGSSVTCSANSVKTTLGQAQSVCNLAATLDTEAPTWTVGLDYGVTPDFNIYVKASRGYKAGGFNPYAVFTTTETFKPEYVTTYEAGFKFNGRVADLPTRFNATGYHTNYRNIQRATGDFNAATEASGAYVVNGDAEIDGAEVEMSFRPIPDVELGGNFSYTGFHYTKFTIPVHDVGGQLDCNGKLAGPAAFGFPTSTADMSCLPGQYVAPYIWSIHADITLPIPADMGELDFFASYSHTASQFTDPAELPGVDPGSTLAGYGLLNVNLQWADVMGKPLDVSLWATNLTDETYRISNANVYHSLLVNTTIYGEPRMFGATVKYRFGGPAEEPEAAPSAYVPPPVQAPAAPHSYLVFFDFNKSDLTAQATQIVDQAASNAGPAKVTRLTVTGHTDTVGSDAYNMRLSRRRAESVAARLEKDGIASSEIEIVAKGKRDLLVPTADGVREPQNRRVQIVYDGGAAS
jgi:iron complex outermembrane receptor protein